LSYVNRSDELDSEDSTLENIYVPGVADGSQELEHP
jgi:hypothetical protein